MSDEFSFIQCDHIGVAGTTPVTLKKTEEGFEARVGIAIFGHTNLNEDGFRAAQYNPFHELFHDNYVTGHGATEEVAIEALKADLHEHSNSLWL